LEGQDEVRPEVENRQDRRSGDERTIDRLKNASASRGNAIKSKIEMIQLINLTKYYGKLAAVDTLNLEVPAGEIFGFLGPNGAGKTTTIRVMMGTKTHRGRPASIERRPTRPKRFPAIPDRPFLYEAERGEFLISSASCTGWAAAIAAQDRRSPRALELTRGGTSWSATQRHGQRLVVCAALILSRASWSSTSHGRHGPQRRARAEDIPVPCREGHSGFLSTHLRRGRKFACINIIQGPPDACGTLPSSKTARKLSKISASFSRTREQIADGAIS
jgi:ABC-2 type transport system ATP-binding protein